MRTPQELLERLDSRHDELLRKLDKLNADIERVLCEFAKSRTAQAPVPLPRQATDAQTAE